MEGEYEEKKEPSVEKSRKLFEEKEQSKIGEKYNSSAYYTKELYERRKTYDYRNNLLSQRNTKFIYWIWVAYYNQLYCCECETKFTIYKFTQTV